MTNRMMERARLTSAIGIGVTIWLLLCSVIWFYFRPGVYSKLLVVLTVMPWFYGLAFGGAAFALLRYARSYMRAVDGEAPYAEVTRRELAMQLTLGIVYLHVACILALFYHTDLQDWEVWNGHVEHVTYQERYDDTECEENCDSDGENCVQTCTCESHGPFWEIHTSNKESITVSATVYDRYRARFGNHQHVGRAGDRCAGNRGFTWQTTFRGSPEERVPTAHLHAYVNYLRASAMFRRENPGTAEHLRMLPDYPQIYAGDLGEIELMRVIEAGLELPVSWVLTLDEQLDDALMDLGAQQQVNVLVVVAKTDDPAFADTLDFHWRHGKKNDVIVVLGTPAFPILDWVRVLAWTRDGVFQASLEDHLLELDDVSDPEQLGSLVLQRIVLPPQEGGFERQPMSELAHLAAEVEVNQTAMLWILIPYLCLVVMLSITVEQNAQRERVRRPDA